MDPRVLALLAPDEAPPANSDRLLALVNALRAAGPKPDLEGLRAAQAADAQREREMALGRAGQQALSLMTRRPVDYTGLTPDQLNVRQWVQRRQEEAQAREGALGPLKAVGPLIEHEAAREFSKAQAEAARAAAAEERAKERDFRDKERDEDREFRRDEGEKGRKAQLEAAKIAAERKNEEKARERSLKLYIGEDFENTGADRELQGKPLADAQTRVAAGRQVLKDTDEILALMRAHGTEVVGKHAAKLSALATNIQLNEKELKNLGVLNGRDLEILERLARDPTEIRSILRDASNVRPMESVFSALRDLTVSDVTSLADSLGFKPKPGGAYASRAKPEAANKPSPTLSRPSRRPRRTVNGETREWDGTKWVPLEP